MDKLSKAYDEMMAELGISLSEAPHIMVLDNEKDRKTIDSYVREHFDPIGSIYDNHVDALIGFNNSSKGLDFRCLIVYDKKDGKSIYFHSRIESKTADLFFKDLKPGEEIYLHTKGRDFEEAMARTKARVPLNFPSKALGDIVSRENEKLGIWYDTKDFHCIDYKLHLEKGIHARPAGSIIVFTKDLKEKKIIDEESMVYLSKKSGDLQRADSIMSLMMMGANTDSVITICSKKKEAAALIYDLIRNMPKDS